jgi:hypothetical protein
MTMNIVRINKGCVDLYENNGLLVKTIGNNNALDADINKEGSLILITTKSGSAELRTIDGSLIRVISEEDVISAKFSENFIHTTTKKGRSELWRLDGSLIWIIEDQG